MATRSRTWSQLELTSPSSSGRLADEDPSLSTEQIVEAGSTLRLRVISFLNNVLEHISSRDLLRLTFTRCTFTPSDLLDSIHLPRRNIQVLSFVKCLLTDAHVTSLLRRARQNPDFFSKMRFLQLSGSLSSGAVVLILRFFDEEVEHPVLAELVVPEGAASVAKGHAIGMRLNNLLVNGKRIHD
jgi:hypothetical protein